jgi:hypothetical protein
LAFWIIPFGFILAGRVRGTGYDWNWRRLRLSKLQADPLCWWCLKQGRLTAANVVDHIVPMAASLKPMGCPSRWRPMTEDGKPLATLLEDAARARRWALVLDGDPAARELERYAAEVEAEIHRRATED